MEKFNLEEFKAGKNAITRSGKLATFVGVCDKCNVSYRLIAYIEGYIGITEYSLEGYYRSKDEKNSNDLIYLVKDYSFIPLDSRVVCKKAEQPEFNAYFAGVDDKGYPMIWEGGCTSFTAAHDCRLPRYTVITPLDLDKQ